MTTLKIEGMTCGHCAMHVKEALNSVSGAQRVDVNLERGEARVEGTADLSALIAAVRDAGYEARLA